MAVNIESGNRMLAPKWAMTALADEKPNVGGDAAMQLLSWHRTHDPEAEADVRGIVYRYQRPAYIANEGRLEIPPIDRVRWVTFHVDPGGNVRGAMGGTT